MKKNINFKKALIATVSIVTVIVSLVLYRGYSTSNKQYTAKVMPITVPDGELRIDMLDEYNEVKLISDGVEYTCRYFELGGLSIGSQFIQEKDLMEFFYELNRTKSKVKIDPVGRVGLSLELVHFQASKTIKIMRFQFNLNLYKNKEKIGKGIHLHSDKLYTDGNGTWIPLQYLSDLGLKVTIKTKRSEAERIISIDEKIKSLEMEKLMGGE